MKKSKKEFKSFYILPDLNLTLRIIITFILIIIAVFMQFYFDRTIPGFIIFFLASIFNIIRNVGYEANPSQRREWKEVTAEEYRKFIKRMEKFKKLQGVGFAGKFTVIFISIFLFIFFGPLITKIFLLNKNLTILIIDFLVLFLPIFLSGNKFLKIESEDDAFIKVKNLSYLMNFPELKTRKYDLMPYFEISEVENKGKIPVDAKVMVKAKDSPPELLGIQFQVSINRVQSRKYPYFYGVIIAKKSFNLFEKTGKLKSRDNIKFELSEQEDVDVIVIRQKTTKRSGYYTDKNVIKKITLISLETFEKIRR